MEQASPGSGPAAREQDDSVLLGLVAEGDMGALRQLYDRHAAWLHVRLMRRCNDSDVVLDVVQDTFVTLWKDARRFRGDGEVAGWLWGIAFRRMVSRLRSRKDVVLLPDWDLGWDLSWDLGWDDSRHHGRGHSRGHSRDHSRDLGWSHGPAGCAPAAEDEVLLGVEYGDLAGALRRLSPEFRAVVQTVVLDGLTTKEAGRLLGVRENTVKTRLHRAKAQLRRALADTAPAPGEGWR